MIDIESIAPLTDFVQKTDEHLETLKTSGRPLILTTNGKAKCVVFSVDSYKDFMDRLDYAESVLAIQEGINTAAKYGTRPADEALAEMAAKYGLPTFTSNDNE
ncbi:MAG: type II toxin-antitoxin system Phd/YefM family antitoxin [Pyrinomonadaceae bacterium]